MKKKLLIWLMLNWLVVASVYCQTLTDSLENALKQPSLPDTQRINILLRLVQAYDYEKTKTDTLAKEALALALKVKNTQKEAEARSLLGTVYSSSGDYPKAMLEHRKALKLHQSNKYQRGIANEYNNVAIIYEYQGNYTKSLESYLKSIRIYEAMKNKRGVAFGYHNLGRLYEEIDNDSLALLYFQKSIDIKKAENLNSSLANSVLGMGVVYISQNEYKKAQESLQEALRLYQQYQNELGMAYAYSYYGKLLEEQQKYDEALTMYQNALKIREKTSDKNNYAISLNRVAHVYSAKGDFELAEEYLQKASQIARSIQNKDLLQECYLTESFFYEQQQKYNDALKAQKNYQALRDSLFKSSQMRQIAQMQAFYDLEQKEVENEFLRQTQTLKDKTIARQKRNMIWAFVGLTLVIALAISLWQVNKKRTKANQQLTILNAELNEQKEEIATMNHMLEQQVLERTEKLNQTNHKLALSNKELDSFLYRASHDLRSPLSTLMGIVEIARMTSQEETARELFDKIAVTAKEMDKMLAKLRTVGQVLSNSPSSQVLDFQYVASRIYQAFSQEMERNKIQFKQHIQVNRTIELDTFWLETIIFCLIENAVQFHHQERNSYIELSIRTDQDYLTISVMDNGIGIDAKVEAQIFDMFFKGNERSQGNGLGLYIVKKIANKLQGEVILRQNDEPPTTHFSVRLPL